MAGYLANINDATLHNAIVQAIRSNRAIGQHRGQVTRQQIVHSALQSLVSVPGSPGNATDLQRIAEQLERAYHVYSGGAEPPDVARIDSVLWELIGRGLVYPRLDVPPGGYNYLQGISVLIVTPLGERYFAAEGASHPAAPDFVSASVSGIAGLPVEVRASLEDAQMCFRQRLLRAAVVMLGLAYEAMAIEIWGSIVRANNKRPPEAKEVLKQIGIAVQSRGESATLAVHVADDIRGARNRAAHDWKLDFGDVGQVETLLILGVRNVAPFWALKG